jgi:hypothetical protein
MVSRALLERASEKGIPIPWLFSIPGDPLEMIFVMPTFTRWNIIPGLFPQPMKTRRRALSCLDEA